MMFDLKTVNGLLGIDDSYKAPAKLLEIMLDPVRKDKLFKSFLEISQDLSFDWFHQYFEEEQAERKSKKQDFTPNSIASLLTELVNHGSGQYYEPTAGTGGILIKKWWYDIHHDPVSGIKDNWLSVITYDPRKYWYQAEELSDRAIPFLLFNMGIRGMNGVVVQCDVLNRDAKDVYFIRNDTRNHLAFSEIIRCPHSEEIKNYFGIEKWVTSFD